MKVAQARPRVNATLRGEGISPMRFRLIVVLAALAATAAGGAATARALPAQNSENASADLRIVVTAGKRNQPVENASVYIRYKETRFLRKDKKVELDLKTNRDGVAVMRDLPRGDIIVQVVAQGWKTFGRHFKLDQTKQTIRIKLEEPPHWY
jgi:hypothetical protein